MRVHTLDPAVFKECNYFKTLEETKQSNFLCTPLTKIYTTIVKMFLSNIHLTIGTIQTQVRIHLFKPK